MSLNRSCESKSWPWKMRALFFILIAMVWVPPRQAVAQESALNSQEIDRKLSTIESKLSELNAVHAQIRSKNSEIQAELQSLKIWIHRNRS